MSRVFLILIFLTGFSEPCLSQGYVVEIRGTWKKSDGTNVGNRQRLAAGVRVQNTSGQSSDAIFIADENGEIIPCSQTCKALVIPTQSWTQYLWCKIFGCGTRKYTTFGAKGGDCTNLDNVATIDQDGKTDLSLFLKGFEARSDELDLRFQKKHGDKIIELRRSIKQSKPETEGLEAGFYDVIHGAINVRILVLPVEVFEKEKARYALVREKMEYWKRQDLSDCTVRTFIMSYLDYVFKEHQTEIQKRKKEEGAKPKSH